MANGNGSSNGDKYTGGPSASWLASNPPWTRSTTWTPPQATAQGLQNASDADIIAMLRSGGHTGLITGADIDQARANPSQMPGGWGAYYAQARPTQAQIDAARAQGQPQTQYVPMLGQGQQAQQQTTTTTPWLTAPSSATPSAPSYGVATAPNPAGSLYNLSQSFQAPATTGQQQQPQQYKQGGLVKGYQGGGTVADQSQAGQTNPWGQPGMTIGGIYAGPQYATYGTPAYGQGTAAQNPYGVPVYNPMPNQQPSTPALQSTTNLGAQATGQFFGPGGTFWSMPSVFGPGAQGNVYTRAYPDYPQGGPSRAPLTATPWATGTGQFTAVPGGTGNQFPQGTFVQGGTTYIPKLGGGLVAYQNGQFGNVTSAGFEPLTGNNQAAGMAAIYGPNSAQAQAAAGGAQQQAGAAAAAPRTPTPFATAPAPGSVGLPGSEQTGGTALPPPAPGVPAGIYQPGIAAPTAFGPTYTGYTAGERGIQGGQPAPYTGTVHTDPYLSHAVSTLLGLPANPWHAPDGSPRGGPVGGGTAQVAGDIGQAASMVAATTPKGPVKMQGGGMVDDQSGVPQGWTAGPGGGLLGALPSNPPTPSPMGPGIDPRTGLLLGIQAPTGAPTSLPAYPGGPPPRGAPTPPGFPYQGGTNQAQQTRAVQQTPSPGQSAPPQTDWTSNTRAAALRRMRGYRRGGTVRGYADGGTVDNQEPSEARRSALSVPQSGGGGEGSQAQTQANAQTTYNNVTNRLASLYGGQPPAAPGGMMGMGGLGGWHPGTPYGGTGGGSGQIPGLPANAQPNAALAMGLNPNAGLPPGGSGYLYAPGQPVGPEPGTGSQVTPQGAMMGSAIAGGIGAIGSAFQQALNKTANTPWQPIPQANYGATVAQPAPTPRFQQQQVPQEQQSRTGYGMPYYPGYAMAANV